MVPDSMACAESGKVALFIDLLNRVGEARLCALGSSMMPSILPGDTLRVERCNGDDVRVGDVVMFTRHGRLFAHRVVSRVDGTLVTKGDSLDSSDGPVAPSEFLGRVISVEQPAFVSRIVRRGRLLRRRLVAAA
jgi:signal peptidase I